MLAVVHRCSVFCKCYVNVHNSARQIRQKGGDFSQLKSVLREKQDCQLGKNVQNRDVREKAVLPWRTITKNIEYFK